MIGIVPSTIQTFKATTLSAGTTVLLTPPTDGRVFAIWVRLVAGAHTDAALQIGGVTYFNTAGTGQHRAVVVGDADETLQVVMTGVAADGEYVVTAGVLGDNALKVPFYDGI